jgi:hypothetical protein
MFALRDQVVFLDLFKPPQGMKLSYCIGTSFSVDLVVLLQLALSSSRKIGSSDLLTSVSENCSAGTKSSLGAMELAKVLPALHDFSKRTVIFCQTCQIQAPDHLLKEGASNRSRVFSLLDACLQVVSPEKRQSAFHPKLWLLCFEGVERPGRKEWRLLVTSRNLSRANTWEVQACFAGLVGRSRGAVQIEGLGGFLKALKAEAETPEAAKHGHAKLIRSALSDLREVRFILPNACDSAELLWRTGVVSDGLSVLNPERYSKMIAVSPFLKVMPLKALRAESDILITGRRDLYVLSQRKDLLAHSAAFLFELRGADSIDLHAKMYLCRRKGGSGTDLFVGSANLTNAAMGNPGKAANTECLIRLGSKKDLVKEFERDFVYKEKRIPSPWLRRVTDADIEGSAEHHREEEKKQWLDDLRRDIGTGRFVLRHRRSAWSLQWQGSQLALPLSLVVDGSILGCKQPFDILAALRGEELLLPGVSQPSAFLHVHLGEVGRAATDFTTVMLVFGRTNTHLQDLVRSVARETDFASMLSAIFQESGIQVPSIPPGDPRERTGKRSSKNRSSLKVRGILEMLLLADHGNESKVELLKETIEVYAKKEPEAVAEFKRVWQAVSAAALEARHG